VKVAERYYRAMFGSRAASWNLRDRHMFETLDALVDFHAARGRREKVVLWAHNSHLGDARATDMGAGGELNVGQLVRQRYHGDARLVGFLTHEGTVTAASDWDEPAERKVVRPALAGSYEALLHETRTPNLLLDLTARGPVIPRLAQPRLERAIGVIYRPETERASHYFHAVLPQQFDAVLYYDHTRAVEPLERTGLWERGEVAETFPSAL
jgi:erythromycin esterase-like protein